MNALVELLALVGILPVGLALFARLRPRHAVLATFLLGTLFLPVGVRDYPGPIDLEKNTTTAIAVLLGVLLFDGARLARFRPGWVDLPVATLVVSPVATSLSNGLGLWDGISVLIVHALHWGTPWLMGRLYFRDRESLRELAIALVLGGLVYMPLCLFEIRFSPQLHDWIYGYKPRPFIMIKRYGGFRPMLFMDSSLMVGMWMALSTMVAWWLWRSGSVRRLLRVPMWAWIAGLVVTTVLCKTVGAVSLMLIGCLAYEVTHVTGRRLALAGIVLAGALYGPLRTFDVVRTRDVTGILARLYDEERIRSLYIRMINEDAMSQKALERPVLGWGGYGRARAQPEEGRSIVDGLWIITFGKFGGVGLVAVTFTYLLPALRLLRLRRRRGLTGPVWAPTMAIGTLGALYWLDSLLNAFVNGVLLMALGSGAGARLAARARGSGAPAAPPKSGDRSADAASVSGDEPAPASLGRGLLGRGRSSPEG